MKELVFALEFRGSAAAVPGSDKKLRAKTSTASQIHRSILNADGIQAPGLNREVSSQPAAPRRRAARRERWQLLAM